MALSTNRLCIVALAAGTVLLWPRTVCWGFDDTPIRQPEKVQTLADVLSAYERATAAIGTFDVYLRQQSRVLIDRAGGEKSRAGAPSPPVRYRRVEPNEAMAQSHCMSRQLWKGGKLRIDVLEAGGSQFGPGQLTVWDGATEKTYVPMSGVGSVRSYVRTYPVPPALAYVNLLWSFDGGFKYSDIIRGCQEARLSRDGKLYVVTAPPQPRNAKAPTIEFGVELALDPDRGMLPVKIAILMRDEPVPQERYEIELAQVHGGVWAPVRIVAQGLFWMDHNSDYYGEPLAETVVEIDRERSRFNIPVDDGLFAFEFPQGTLVHDEIRNIRYRVGAETRKDYLNMVAVMGRLSAEELQKSRPAMRTTWVPALDPSGIRMLVLANVIAISLLAGVVLYRRRRRGQHHDR